MSTKGKDAEIFNLGAILLNIPGQVYVVGSQNRTNGEEHFILCSLPNVEERHCKIFVDKRGEFWIQNLDVSAQTFINHESLTQLNQPLLRKKKKLTFGDIICFGEGGRTRRTAFTYFEFKERKTKEEPKKLAPRSWEVSVRGIIQMILDLLLALLTRTPFPSIDSEVGSNPVVVKNILEHFSVEELKKCRFVSKKWNIVASELLRKRCAVSIPKSKLHEQTKLFRCAKEMEDFASNMTSLSVEMPEFSSDQEGDQDADKFFEDLVKYQLKDCLTYFKISARRVLDERIPLLDKILAKVSLTCPNLEHLALDIDLERNESRTLPPDSDWSFGPNLKVLEVFDEWHRAEFSGDILLGKIVTTKLEKFTSRGVTYNRFLSVMHQKDFCNLKEISLNAIGEEDLRALENLPSNVLLQKLVLSGIERLDLRRVSRSLSNVLEKFSKTLVSLTMTCRGGNVVLPRFEKLENLSLFYDGDTELTFPPQFFYSTDFPKLKSLSLNSRKIGGGEDVAFSEYTKAEALAQWGLNEELFNSFVPSGQVCSSLEVLDIPHCPPESYEENQEYEDRLEEMRTLFPNVKGKWIKAGKY